MRRGGYLRRLPAGASAAPLASMQWRTRIRTQRDGSRQLAEQRLDRCESAEIRGEIRDSRAQERASGVSENGGGRRGAGAGNENEGAASARRDEYAGPQTKPVAESPNGLFPPSSYISLPPPCCPPPLLRRGGRGGTPPPRARVQGARTDVEHALPFNSRNLDVGLRRRPDQRMRL